MNPGDARKLMKLPTIEALLSVARGRVSANAVTKLADLGLYLDGEPDPTLEAEKWALAVKIVGSDLFPELAALDAHRRVAHLVLESFATTLIGKVMITVGQIIGRQRSLDRLTHNFRTGANFIECRLTRVSEQIAEVWINDVSDVPGFYLGMLEFRSMLHEPGAERVELVHRDGPACTFRLTRIPAR